MTRRKIPIPNSELWLSCVHEVGHGLFGWLHPRIRVKTIEVNGRGEGSVNSASRWHDFTPTDTWFFLSLLMAGMASELVYTNRIRSYQAKKDLQVAQREVLALSKKDPSGHSPWLLGRGVGLQPSSMFHPRTFTPTQALMLDEAFHFARLKVSQYTSEIESLSLVLARSHHLDASEIALHFGPQL